MKHRGDHPPDTAPSAHRFPIGHPTPSVIICFAVPEESQVLRRKRRDLKTLHTGMGRKNATQSLSNYLDHHRPQAVISAGFAGGLNPNLETGTVLFQFPQPLPVKLEGDFEGARAGRFRCSDRIVVTRSEKALLWEATGHDAVEMESEPICQVAASHRIPSLILRVISDSANDDLPLDFNRLVTRDMRISLPKLGLTLARHPTKIPKLIRFHRTIQRAATRLSDAIDWLLPKIP